jgi:hypothetical protein
MAVLFYFLNPTLTSLRGLQTATDAERVQRALGIRRMSLGSMSESVRQFDPDRLAAVFEALARRMPGRTTDPRFAALRQVLTAVDGSIFRAVPRMAWALWLGDGDRGVKAHVQFDVIKGVPARAQVTPGQGAETACLAESLEPGRLYVLDRGYAKYALLRRIVEADSSFVVRMPGNTVSETVEERPLTPEAVAAGVRADRIVRLGCRKSRRDFDRPVRLIEVHVAARSPRGRGAAATRVSSKKTFRLPAGAAYTLRIATDRTDLPADVIALIYRHRWRIELFFRVLKDVFRCRHLISRSYEGVCVQIYCALIVALLLAEFTGVKAGKRAYEALVLYLHGWLTDAEFLARRRRLAREHNPNVPPLG